MLDQYPEDETNQQEQEPKPEYARPMNPLLSGRLGRLAGIGPSPYRNAGAGGEVWVFIILFVILVSTLIGAATRSLLIGIVAFVIIIALAICINVVLAKLRSSRRTDNRDQM